MKKQASKNEIKRLITMINESKKLPQTEYRRRDTWEMKKRVNRLSGLIVYK